MTTTIICLVICLLLFSYSFLRYRYLWSRRKVPNVVYYVFQILLSGTLFVCFFAMEYVPNGYLMWGIQFVSACYLTVMIVTPVFYFFRGAVRMLGKRLHWKNRCYRFFNHPTKMSKIALTVTLLLGIGVFVQSKIPYTSETMVQTKKSANIKSLSIATLSDLQMGQCTTRFDIENVFEQLEKMNPDVIVLMGEVFSQKTDSEICRLLSEKIESLILNKPVYYVEGPNSFGQEKVMEQLKKMGVQLLMDETIRTSEGIQIVGCRSQKNANRRDVDYTFSLIDRNKPAIVFSYQDLSDKEKQMVDYDVILHAPLYGNLWLLPRQICMTQVYFA